ncbi:hypothetical protein BpHYR1_044475 [Brachionus plicatilis]|uniref:Uncharacterized protein n=1 Tax=Brachionus plicatilis TaxID=10195 RepID=A0A3M7SYY4_BRAPC|nr:hypothetical protein BpHYR1_044475 [Brachionus plicatilis]
MISKIFFNHVLSFLWFHAKFVNSQSSCNFVVNGKNFDDKKLLYVDKKYDLSFGMMLNESKNNVIAFAFDAECYHSNNLSKSKWFYSLDLDDKIIELNALNCPETFFIKNFNLKLSSKISFLSFKFNFKTNQSPNLFDLKLKLSLNRRLGKGCSSTIMFHKNTNSAMLDYYDYEIPIFRSSFEILPRTNNNFEFKNLSESKNQIVDLESICETKEDDHKVDCRANIVKSKENSINEFQVLRDQLLNKEKKQFSYEKEHGLEPDLSKNIIFQN